MTDQANQYQVGGTHYASSYQHWDLASCAGLGYLEGTATKYLARWRKAGKPKQDLEKSRHYVIKLRENILVVPVRLRPIRWVRQETVKFCKLHNIEGRERHLFLLICSWETDDDLALAVEIITEMIASVQLAESEGKPVIIPAAPVPVSDSNKHADRHGDKYSPDGQGMAS